MHSAASVNKDCHARKKKKKKEISGKEVLLERGSEGKLKDEMLKRKRRVNTVVLADQMLESCSIQAFSKRKWRLAS